MDPSHPRCRAGGSSSPWRSSRPKAARHLVRLPGACRRNGREGRRGRREARSSSPRLGRSGTIAGRISSRRGIGIFRSHSIDSWPNEVQGMVKSLSELARRHDEIRSMGM